MISRILCSTVLIIFMFTSICFAQTVKYSGLVFDSKSNQPLKGANIYLKNYSFGTVTDKEGYFSFEIPVEALNDTLIVKYLGFVDYSQQINTLPHELTIYLKPKILSLEDEIIIYGDKINLSKKEIPHTSYTISTLEIQNYGTSEISDIFKMDPSIQIEGNELDGKHIQIRGSDPDEVNVYIDGILVNNIGFESSADLSIIPTENIEKIEILKGGNLMLLGNGAFGGVVNITTNRKLYPEYSTKVKFGSFHSKYITGNINVPVGKKLFLNYFGLWNNILPEIESFTGEQFSEKTTGKSLSLTKHNHHISLNYFTDKGQFTTKLIGYLFNYEKPDWTDNRKNIMLASSYKGEIIGLTEMDLSFNYTYNTDDIIRDVSSNQFFEYNYKTQRLNLRSSKNINVANADNFILDIQLLSEYYHDEAVSSQQFNNTDEMTEIYYSYLFDNRASFAALTSFGNYTDTLNSFSWKAFAGIRGDFLANGDKYKTDNFGIQFSYKKRQWKLSPFLSYGENIKFPALLEYAHIRDIVDLSIGNDGDKNIKIKPEYISASEIGVKFEFNPYSAYYNRFEVETSFFSNKIFNKIITRPISNIPIKTQTGECTIKGFEASIKFLELFSFFNISAGYTGVDVSNHEIYLYKPDEKSNLRVNYQSSKGFYFISTYFYEGKSTAIVPNDIEIGSIKEESVSPFFDVDLAVGYQFNFKKFKLNLQISGYNILDNSGYRDYYLKKRFLQSSLSITY